VSQPHSVDGPTLVVGVSLLGLAFAALWAASPLPELDGRLDFWRPEPAVLARLGQIRESRLTGTAAPAEAVEALTVAWGAANSAPWTPGPGVRHRVQSAEQRFRTEAADFIAVYGVPAYAVAGEGLADAFVAALVAFVDAAGAEHKGSWLGGHPDHSVTVRLRFLSGEFPERALSSGLLPPMESPDQELLLVARVMWTTHWFEIARRGLAAEMMAPEERLLLRLWKLEAATHLTWQRRRAILEEVQAMALDYPADYVLGILAVREGRYMEARAAFTAALEAGYRPALVRRWLSWLSR